MNVETATLERGKRQPATRPLRISNSTYVLVTPVRNEQNTIGITIESVIRQTVLPAEWIIVSDESTDKTDEIVKQYAAKHPFIRLLRLEQRPGRNFGSVVFATEAGIAELTTKSYSYIGLLDADIRFSPTYYEEIIRRFEADPKLGLAGGIAIDYYDGKYHPGPQAMTEVAGAVQFFRRECFDKLGGLLAVREGGWDTITAVQARMNGYTTATFGDLVVDHLKPRNIGEGSLVHRTWQMGLREYALGNHPLFEIAKCTYRCTEKPYVLGAFLRFAGYAWSALSRKKRVVSQELVKFIRREQMRRLFKRG